VIKLLYSPTSPFVRKVLVVARERGLENRIERVAATAHPVNRNDAIAAINPLAKVPAAITAEGLSLFDSRVICEYLDSLAGAQLFPPAGPARWSALTCQALADGMVDAAVLVRYETHLRPQPLQWAAWRDAQTGKVERALAGLEATLDQWGAGLTIGSIAAGCGLGYLDFRFPDLHWRQSCPRLAAWLEAFSARPSMQATVPRDTH
jgi:glutathione S-transferase